MNYTNPKIIIITACCWHHETLTNKIKFDRLFKLKIFSLSYYYANNRIMKDQVRHLMLQKQLNMA